ncbi:MAG: dicarboxylate/amino acid:cation symporter [Candidatus Methanomethyliaceae archaeon]|nr:dicarboxylate/amino acid:cation symporter [Candidatus Methanomethyliaceae archaeon]MDW7970426.1 dicarboxylate/amino acid:cation symporter [Nitrososphaerota archaeon]
MDWKKHALIIAIAIGFILGLITGLSAGKAASVLKPLGDLFIRLMRMIVTPLVIITITAAIAQIVDLRRLGKLIIGMFIIFIFLSALGASIMLWAALAFGPGVGVGLSPPPGYTPPTPPSVVDLILGVIPFDFVDIFSVAGLLKAIFFSIVLGLAISLAGEKGKPIARALQYLSEVILKVVMLVMWVAPIGVFGYAAWLMGTYGTGILVAYGKLITLDYSVSLAFFFIVYTIVVALSKRNPIVYWKNIIEPALVAFTTRSSAVTLPVNIRAAQRIGIPDYVTSLVLPVGATCHMDGTAMYQVLCAVFIAQAFGITLDPSLFGTIIVVGTLAAVATAAIPGGGLLMLATTVAAAGLPLEGIALIVAIDPILDMLRTMINASGDVAVATVMARVLEGPKWFLKSS